MSNARFETALSNNKYSQGSEIERSSKVYFRSLVPTAEGARALDIGCGTGLNARELDRKGYRVSGIDLSPVAIEKYNEAGFDGQVCDIGQGLPFAEDSFELVFASDVIEHLVDTDYFVSEIHRVLKPNGVAVVSTVNSSFWAFRILTILGKTPTDFQHPGHLRFFSPRTLKNRLEDAGFCEAALYSRSMYLIISENWAGPFGWLLDRLSLFKREMRFRTKKEYWHLSKVRRGASTLWADSIMVIARKPL